MRIAYITAGDPKDVRVWSGLGHFIWKSLAARGVEVELIGPLPLPRHVHALNHLRRYFYQRVQGKFYWNEGDLTNVRAHSRAAGRKLKSLPPVDAVVSANIFPSAFLPGELPLVSYSDSTLRTLFKTYPAHANMAGRNYRHADKIELSAQRRAAALVYASEWAADSARKDYSTDPAKIHVVPFGANLETTPSRASVEKMIATRDPRELRLLFIGMDWQRKGGPVALAVTRELNRMNIPAGLTVIGCNPLLDEADQKFVNVLGFIEKTVAGQAKIQAELSRSHFLIVPSVAECFGIVYCEASALGVPSIARNVGGVASAVRNGRNGQRFELEDTPAQIAAWIAEAFKDFQTYQRLALSSLTEYETHLNWNVAGEKLERIIRTVIAKK